MSVAAIRLHPGDNVAVCARDVADGEPVADGLLAAEPVALGHKIALVAIAPGERIWKYGMAIGSATRAIAAGGWVHLHNMKSDYLPAHLRGGTTAAE